MGEFDFQFRMNDFTKSVRFAGTQRLFGEDGLARLGNARVAIIGIGGVGSWALKRWREPVSVI